MSDRIGLHLRGRRQHPVRATETAGGTGITALAQCQSRVADESSTMSKMAIIAISWNWPPSKSNEALFSALLIGGSLVAHRLKSAPDTGRNRFE